MRERMNSLAGFLGRRRRWVLAGWVLVLVLALPLAARQTEHLTGGGFDVPGSDSMAASEAVQREFGGDSNGIAVVLKATPGSGAAAHAAAVGRVRRAVAGIEDVALPPSAARAGVAELGHSGVAMLPLRSRLSPDELIDPAATLREELDPGVARGGVTTYLAGQPTIWAGMQELSKKDLSEAEAGGFPIVAIILLVVFGSLAAAALPLALGFVSVIVTGALIYFISLQMSTSVFVTNMASMIGIGVAIDYSLFILARYREERAAGRSCDDARAEALSTSGLAVTFSGLAVIVSLAGLWMVDNQALRSMALGAMTVVAISILAATTLLPALIAMLGDRVLPGGIVARVSAGSSDLSRVGPSLPDAAARASHIGFFWPSRERRKRRRILGALDAHSDGSPLDGRDRRHRAAPLPRDPGPLAEHGDRAAAAVPQGQRRPGRQRTGLRAGGRRDRPGPARRLLRRARRGARTSRRDRRLRAAPGSDPRRRLRRPAGLRRRRRAGQSDPDRAERVQPRRSPWSSGCATRSSPRPPWRGSRPSTSAAKPPAAMTCGR